MSTQKASPVPLAQVYWLLLAYTQDHPKDRNVIELRDRCEQAAMEGYWVSLRTMHSAAPSTLTYNGNCVMRKHCGLNGVVWRFASRNRLSRIRRCCP